MKNPELFTETLLCILILALIIYPHTYGAAYGIEIKIVSPLNGQEVPIGELAISGSSSDTSSSDCQVYLDWNDQKPYQKAIANGSGGSDDYSTWKFTYSSNYHLIQEGNNELTSKITCQGIPSPSNSSSVNSTEQSKWYSINVTGVKPSVNPNSGLPLPGTQ
jgi:hypothetical protein